MRLGMQRILALVLAVGAAAALWIAAGCSGSSSNPSGTLEGALLQHENIESVSFTLSGRASCSDCKPADVIGLMVEVYPQGDPTHQLALANLDGLGPFNLGELRIVKGTGIEVLGTLYMTGNNGAADVQLRASQQLSTPDDDGEAVAAMLNFQP